MEMFTERLVSWFLLTTNHTPIPGAFLEKNIYFKVLSSFELALGRVRA